MDGSRGRLVVTGGHGFVGAHLIMHLVEEGLYRHSDIVAPSHREADLRDRTQCAKLVQGADAVVHLAANVAGIGYLRSHPATVFHDNAAMGLNLIDACHEAGVRRLVCLGSALSYPSSAPLPWKEEDLWSGYPNQDADAYGLAKLFVLAQMQFYHRQHGLEGAYLIPSNIYGPGKAITDWRSANVIPAMVRKVFLAKSNGQDHVEVWGSGRATRDFLYVEDAVAGIAAALERCRTPDPINLGGGTEVSIETLVRTIMRLMEYEGDILWNRDMPDGQPRMACDIARARETLNFKPRVDLEEGLRRTVGFYLQGLRAGRV